MLTAIERRQAVAILEAFAPPRPSAQGDGKHDESVAESGERPVRCLAPREGEVDYLDSMLRMLQACNGRARLGVRLILFVAMFAPFWMLGRFRTMATMPLDDRCTIVQRLLRHRVFFIRELMMLLKIGASMALLGTPSIRARSGYDRREEKLAAAKNVRALPVVRASVA